MQLRIQVSGIPETMRLIEKAEALASGQGGLLRPAWKAIGVEALRMVSENMTQQGSKVGGWVSLSPVTILLRRRGRGGKIADEAGLETKRGRIRILFDTGLLFNSLHSGRQGNILTPGDYQVIVGTADRKAQSHQKGGITTPFDFSEGSENKKRFDANVVKRLPGPPPQRTGKKKTHSNPFYGKWFVILKGMHGKSYAIPKRPIFWEFKSPEVAQFAAILQRFIDKKLEGPGERTP